MVLPYVDARDHAFRAFLAFRESWTHIQIHWEYVLGVTTQVLNRWRLDPSELAAPCSRLARVARHSQHLRSTHGLANGSVGRGRNTEARVTHSQRAIGLAHDGLAARAELLHSVLRNVSQGAGDLAQLWRLHAVGQEHLLSLDDLELPPLGLLGCLLSVRVDVCLGAVEDVGEVQCDAIRGA